MKRYWILANKNSNSAIISPPTEEQPENSLLYIPTEFIKPFFDTYPNPNTIVEGVTQEDIDKDIKSKVPKELTLGKLMSYLALIGLEQKVLDAIEDINDAQQKLLIKTYLKYGGFVDRDSEATNFIQQTLQKTDAEVDIYFIEADNIQF